MPTTPAAPTAATPTTPATAPLVAAPVTRLSAALQTAAAQVAAAKARIGEPKATEAKASTTAAEETLRRRAAAVWESLEIAEQTRGIAPIRRTAQPVGDIRVSLLEKTNQSIDAFLKAEDQTSVVDLLKSTDKASEKKTVDDLYAEKKEDRPAEKTESKQLEASLYRTAGTGDLRSLRGYYDDNAA